MKLEEIFTAYNDYLVPSYSKQPLVFVKGKGSYLWDIHGKKYLDFFPGWGVGNLGHCHPKVMAAVRDQVSRLIFIPNNYYNIPQARLAKEINFWTKEPFKLFFCNSGAEANEAAIKLSRKFGQGRYEIITFENSFHGRTMGALSATGQKKYQQGFSPLLEGFKVAKFNDLQSVKDVVNPKTIGIMLELIQGEGGINIADADFIKSLRKICDEQKILLIIDEVQTGLARTGKMFAWQNYGITPDIFTLAKALGGGLPVGVMLAKRELADCLTAGSHASTFGGGPVICKAALAVLNAIQKEKLIANTNLMGQYFRERLKTLKDKYPVIKEIRGMGLMLGIELAKEGKPIVSECLKDYLLINCTHDNVLRIMPALNVTRSEINKACCILDKAFERAKL